MKTIITYRNNPWSLFEHRAFSQFEEFEDRILSSNYDFEENEKYYVLRFDLPGVKKENLKLEVKDRIITVTGERKKFLKKDVYSASQNGSFERSFVLPDHLDLDRIEAAHEDGVLTVLLPKQEVQFGKKIEIQSGDNGKGLFAKLLGHLKEGEQTAA
jgi:HSP20 family protein